MVRSPLVHWLSVRVKLLCVAFFVLGMFLPPYVPRTAQAFEDDTPLAAQQFLFVEEGFLMKTSSLGQQGSRLAYGEGIIHKVKDGESLEGIAKRYSISAQTVRWANDLPDTSTLKPGQELVILPVDGVLHAVRKGQTLARIADLYSIPQADIARQNHIRDGFIAIGQQLIIPGGKPVLGDRTIAAADTGNLSFGQKLTGKDIDLRLTVPNSGKTETPERPLAPIVSAVITQTVLQTPCSSCLITQYFNARHFAIDMQTKGGGPIFASEDGVVIRADMGWNGGYGNVIEVDHGNGLVTLYAHNKQIFVKNGERVSRGQQIGFMGNSGLVYGPTGIHIHFEVRVNGVKKNPLLYLE
ncbi:MAG: peptidoglycan DD-metalloendopeptidase family protein [Candidatus Peribacteraceae bacterium]|jgi:murein DD-endopeptidase MepM/ murein hydrolase activator NlpD